MIQKLKFVVMEREKYVKWNKDSEEKRLKLKI